MPQYSPPRPNIPLRPQRRPVPNQPRPAGLQAGSGAGAPISTTPAPAAIGTAPTTDPPKWPDLNLNKIVAGAGAAATAAVAGSFFGAEGTVLGAALGSVISTLATAIYQLSLDRTRDRVKVRITLPARRTTGSADLPTTMLSPVVPAHPRRRWVALTGVTVGVFLIGLLAVTGVEVLKGSTLTRGDSGTSVGRVVDPVPAPAEPTEPTGTGASASTETAEPAETGPSASTETAEPTGTSTTPTAEPTAEAPATGSATDEPDGDVGRGSGPAPGSPAGSPTGDGTEPETTPAATPTPTRDADGD
jgi:hypothetical protein